MENYLKIHKIQWKNKNENENDTYANVMTTKSSQFHASRRYVNGHRMKPRAITLTADSNV